MQRSSLFLVKLFFLAVKSQMPFLNKTARFSEREKEAGRMSNKRLNLRGTFG